VANQYNKNTAEGDERKYNVNRIVPHPDYVSGAFPNDIALMRLSAPMVLDDLVQPIALKEYGHIAPAGSKYSLRSQTIWLKLVSNKVKLLANLIMSFWLIFCSYRNCVWLGKFLFLAQF